jgi:spermidine/putrescine-binding protein
MIRKAFFALALTFAGSTAAFAADNAQAQAASQNVTNLTVSEYPSQPGPHTVIYREWSDLAG